MLLTLGLFLVACSVNALRVYEGTSGQDVTKRLEELHAKKLQLELTLRSSRPLISQFQTENQLQDIMYWIDYLEDTSKVSYQDHKRLVAGQKHDFEKEKESLRKQLERAEEERIQALDHIGTIQKEDQAEIDNYQKKVTELNREKNRIAEQYADLIELQYQQHEIMNREMNTIMKEREEMRQKLDHAQIMHSRALEAMAIATQEGYKPVSIPYQKEIDELRNEMGGFDQGLSLQETELIDELLTTQTKLGVLLEKLCTEGDIPTDAAHKELEDELAQIEMDARRVRDQHDSRRNEILGSIKSKRFTGYDEDEITSLQMANQQILETNKNLQVIARRSAYLKAISQVNDMLNESSAKVRDAIERNAAELRIQEETNNLQDNAQDEEEEEEDPEIIYDMIHQKYLLYKDMNELYRTKLSTEFVVGLAKINEPLPLPFPGCDTSRLREIRDRMGQWANGVQYALRLTKTLHKDGNRSMIARFFVKFLKSLQNAFRRLLGRKIEEETNLEDDDSTTTSLEIFENQEDIDFNKHYEYVTSNMKVLDADEETTDTKLGLFRFNFIFVKTSPDAIQETALGMFQEHTNDPTNKGKQSEAFREILKEMDAAEVRLHQLFNMLMTHVTSNFAKKDREYQQSLEEYKRCRYNTFRSVMPL